MERVFVFTFDEVSGLAWVRGYGDDVLLHGRLSVQEERDAWDALQVAPEHLVRPALELLGSGIALRVCVSSGSP